ncbi:MAG: alpha/beta hydrolase [Gammaproteobacteria bacterium]|nr:alpha/beta hydrolase [Gammaproteobacteria bacterium]
MKETLVFVHGYFGGSRQWDNQTRAFNDRFQVITTDLPGFGLNNSQESPESISGYARYVHDEINKLGIERFHLVGHSMGGMIVQEMTAQKPHCIDHLVLYGTGPIGFMPGRFETIDESRARITKEGAASTGRRIAATWFLEGESSTGYSDCAEIAAEASEQAALAALTAMENWSGTQKLCEIQSPTLVLWGDGDRAYQWEQPQQLWQEISGAQLAVIPGCSHSVHIEKPHLFNPILLDFLLVGNP